MTQVNKSPPAVFLHYLFSRVTQRNSETTRCSRLIKGTPCSFRVMTYIKGASSNRRRYRCSACRSSSSACLRSGYVSILRQGRICGFQVK